MNEEEKKYPWVGTGALILNNEGKFFLMKSPKWKDQLVIPGGHVEWGEKIEECLKREVLEETGLEIANPHLLAAFEFINDKDYKDGKQHFVSLNYLVDLVSDKDDVKLDGDEGTEHLWLSPDEILARDDVNDTLKKDVQIYKEKIACEEYKAGWQRALADYKNLQNEVARCKSDWARMSEAQMVEEFLPVYDNFKKAFGSLVTPSPRRASRAELRGGAGGGVTEAISEDNTWQNWKQGIEYIMKQFGDVLKAHGVEEIKTVGERFDPRWHEAVGEEEAEGAEAGAIVREVDSGYKMGDRVLKAAKVIVGK